MKARAQYLALEVRIKALADRWEGWARTRSTPRIDAFRDAAEELRAALDPDSEPRPRLGPTVPDSDRATQTPGGDQ